MAMVHVGATELQLSCSEEVGKQTSLNFKEIEYLHPRAGKAEKEQEMSKRIMKNLTMLTLVVVLTMAAAVVSANGQMTSTLVTADIPFDFIVGDKTLPAGKYTVRSAASNGLRISSRDNESSAMRLSNLAVETSKKRNARMVFHRYGQQYFLAEVWSGDHYGRQLVQSKKQRYLRHELASNASKSDSSKGSFEIVEVVAQVR